MTGLDEKSKSIFELSFPIFLNFNHVEGGRVRRGYWLVVSDEKSESIFELWSSIFHNVEHVEAGR